MNSTVLTWSAYGEDGLRAVTLHGHYVIGTGKSGWWAYFHCGCCRQTNQVVLCDSDLDRVKTKCVEHADKVLKRYQEAGL